MNKPSGLSPAARLLAALIVLFLAPPVLEGAQVSRPSQPRTARSPQPYNPYLYQTPEERAAEEKTAAAASPPATMKDPDRYITDPQLFLEQSMLGYTPPPGMNPALSDYGTEQSLLALPPRPGAASGAPPRPGGNAAPLMIFEPKPPPKDDLTKQLHKAEDEYMKALQDPAVPEAKLKAMEQEINRLMRKTYMPEK